MIWRKADNQDTAEFIQLSREPMGGAVKLVWGFDTLQAPIDCTDFKNFVAEEDHRILGTACSWQWPCGSRYLSNLRFSRDIPQRPGPKFWKQAYRDMLSGVSYAWTCIGRDNRRARRILESGSSWLPQYRARQEIRTWFIPLSPRKRAQLTETNHTSQLCTAKWRHVAIASGEGMSFRAGRILYKLGLSGIPETGRKLDIAYFQPGEDESPENLRRSLSKFKGYDGLVVVLPRNSEISKTWEIACPALSWTWDSTLYSVSWEKSALDIAIPKWKGVWL